MTPAWADVICPCTVRTLPLQVASTNAGTFGAGGTAVVAVVATGGAVVVVVTGATVSRGRAVVGVVVTGCLSGAETTSRGVGGSAGAVVTDVVVVVVGEGVELAVVRM